MNEPRPDKKNQIKAIENKITTIFDIKECKKKIES